MSSPNQISGAPFTPAFAIADFNSSNPANAWAAQKDCSLAWVSLDEADNDPGQFWNYLASALIGALPSLEASLPGLPQSSQDADLDFFRQELLNQLAALDLPFFLALDDYHLI